MTTTTTDHAAIASRPPPTTAGKCWASNVIFVRSYEERVMVKHTFSREWGPKLPKHKWHGNKREETKSSPVHDYTAYMLKLASAMIVFLPYHPPSEQERDKHAARIVHRLYPSAETPSPSPFLPVFSSGSSNSFISAGVKYSILAMSPTRMRM